MKKTYIIPNTAVTLLNSREHLLDASAKLIGDVSVSSGGVSTGGMTSDVKQRVDYNVWNDDWSE